MGADDAGDEREEGEEVEELVPDSSQEEEEEGDDGSGLRSDDSLEDYSCDDEGEEDDFGAAGNKRRRVGDYSGLEELESVSNEEAAVKMCLRELNEQKERLSAELVALAGASTGREQAAAGGGDGVAGYQAPVKSSRSFF